ncbi:Ribosomal RNA-processing protein 7, partial [Bienertia sinuspersici]
MSIKVRIIHLWKPLSFEKSKEDITIEMVFMEEKNGKIQATVKKSLIKQFVRLHTEHQLIVITNFGVTQNNKNFITTQLPYMINFILSTVANDYKDELLIPLY